MKLLFCAAFFALSAFAGADSKDFGQGISLSTEPVSLTKALQDFSQNKDKDILVKASVETVCQEKGCWMRIKDGEQKVRVTFKGYSFFVPKDSAKKEALVQGKLLEKTISAAEARHYAKDEGKSKSEVAKITEAQKSYWFEATGVRLF